MSNDNNSSDNTNTTTNSSWSGIASSILGKCATVNLNPFAAVKGAIDERKSKPLPMGMKEAKEKLESAQEEVKRAKMLTKIAEKASFFNTELNAFADDLKELGASEELQAFVRAAGVDLVENVTSEF